MRTENIDEDAQDNITDAFYSKKSTIKQSNNQPRGSNSFLLKSKGSVPFHQLINSNSTIERQNAAIPRVTRQQSLASILRSSNNRDDQFDQLKNLRSSSFGSSLRNLRSKNVIFDEMDKIKKQLQSGGRNLNDQPEEKLEISMNIE